MNHLRLGSKGRASVRPVTRSVKHHTRLRPSGRRPLLPCWHGRYRACRACRARGDRFRETPPAPISMPVTGISEVRASSISSSDAPDKETPPPARITGRFALLISPTTFLSCLMFGWYVGIRSQVDRVRLLIHDRIGKNIFRQIDQHRPRTAGSGNMKRFFDDPRQVFGA